MQKINHFYHSIQGWPNQLPWLYQQMVLAADNGSHFVEVGSWKGASAASMCVEIINSEKNIKFDCVDLWPEYAPDNSLDHYPDNALYKEFMKNLEPVAGTFNAIQLPSIEAAKLYEDNSLDFVCIDGSHHYDDVKADILAWMPKVRSGGILAGDDFPYEGVARSVKELCPGATCEIAWWWTKP